MSACDLLPLRGALALAWALAACSPSTPVVRVDEVLLNAPGALDARAQDRDAIRLGVLDRLRGDTSVRVVPTGENATHAVQLDFAALDARVPQWTVRVRLVAKRGGGDYAAWATGAPTSDLAGAVLGLFERAWDLVGRQRALDVVRDARLQDELHGEYEPQVRAFIVERLGERRVKSAVEPLSRLLSEEKHEEVRLRAVGALVAIGDRRAVEPMIELTSRKDPAFVIPLIFALAQLGGATVEGYLVTVASGHPDESVRRAAADALGELSRAAARDERLTAPPGSN